MQNCSCIICKKEYSHKGIHTHYIINHTTEGRLHHEKTCKLGAISRGNNRRNKCLEIKQQKQNEYYLNPSHCKQCNTILTFDRRTCKYCTRSCAASYNNAHRTLSEETKQKISNTLKNCSRVNNRKRAQRFNRHLTYPEFAYLKRLRCVNINKLFPQWESIFTNSGPFSRIWYNKCKHCSKLFCHKRHQKYCSDCTQLYSDGRNKYLFTFNLFHYPDLFDLDRLKQVGFYQRNAKDKEANVNRLTRDHKVTVNEAVRYDYNTFYITHPLNCELLTWIENNKKNTTSSLTYEQLVTMVDEYELKKHVHVHPTF